jgi:hypothetical protein
LGDNENSLLNRIIGNPELIEASHRMRTHRKKQLKSASIALNYQKLMETYFISWLFFLWEILDGGNTKKGATFVTPFLQS